MPLFEQKNKEKGQILLIVVLASVISLTVGLAAISRSITNTRVSTEESNSQKALSAAEAGIEEQLNKTNIGTSSPTGKTLSNDAHFDAQATAVEGTNFTINNGNQILQDEGADVWLSTYPKFDFPSGTPPSPPLVLSVYWYSLGASGCETTDPAIEVAVVYGPDKTTNASMARYVADACAARRTQNGFTGTVVNDTSRPGFNRRFDMTIVSGYIARVIPLYANSKIAIGSTQALPPQGYIISSTGKSGETVRKVRVYQGFPRLPIEFFPYNLFLP